MGRFSRGAFLATGGGFFLVVENDIHGPSALLRELRGMGDMVQWAFFPHGFCWEIQMRSFLVHFQ